MGREIKFRAWDEHCKILGEVTFMNDVGSDSWEVDYLGNNGEPKTGLIIEQSTGLHDKNGKEIYEGDYVEDDATGAVGCVTFEEGSFDCGNTFEYKGFVELCLRGRIKIIGNIHEAT